MTTRRDNRRELRGPTTSAARFAVWRTIMNTANVPEGS